MRSWRLPHFSSGSTCRKSRTHARESRRDGGASGSVGESDFAGKGYPSEAIKGHHTGTLRRVKHLQILEKLQPSIHRLRGGLQQCGHALEEGAQGRGGLGGSFDHHAAVLLAADLKLREKLADLTHAG